MPRPAPSCPSPWKQQVSAACGALASLPAPLRGGGRGSSSPGPSRRRLPCSTWKLLDASRVGPSRVRARGAPCCRRDAQAGDRGAPRREAFGKGSVAVLFLGSSPRAPPALGDGKGLPAAFVWLWASSSQGFPNASALHQRGERYPLPGAAQPAVDKKRLEQKNAFSKPRDFPQTFILDRAASGIPH